MDDFDPDQIRSRTFSQARRGYDRSEVDAFRDSVADQLAALAGELDSLQSRLKQLGLEDPQDLKHEFDAVGSEVQAVLQAARRAAEEMRSRASADAARWRAEADEEARTVRNVAKAESTELRTSAWETGVELLDQSQKSAADIVRGAEQDALFIRAEAERETLRMTADARRDADEERRTARTEAERTLLDARAESESILASARQSAEAAQERARALEERRAELMKELESARESIGQMEQEIDSRREALYMAGVNEPSGMRVITPDTAPPEWDPDEAGVRVVPVARLSSAEPVDADAMANEVRMLRSGDSAEDEVAAQEAPEPELPEPVVQEPATDEPVVDESIAPEPVVPEPELAETVVAQPVAEEPAVAEPAPKSAAEEPVAAEPRLTEPEAVPIAEQPIAEQPIAEQPIAEPPLPEPAASEADASAPAAGAPDDLSGLFAKLRTPPPPQPDVVPAEVAPADVAPADVAPADVPPAADPVDAPSPVPARAATIGSAVDPFELRDRLLLPIQNRALRTVKRRLVDLQNRVLEELRVDGVDWEPEAAMFRAALADGLAPVRQEAFVAGFTAAAELYGHVSTPSPAGSVPQDAAPDFVAGLLEAVADALHRARASHSGTRQASSAVSKVFRAWRTDEAERRVRWSARAAYHRGVAGGLAALGTPLVTSIVSGRICEACPGCTTQTWDPSDWSAPTAPLPPATSECSATVVPAGLAPSP